MVSTVMSGIDAPVILLGVVGGDGYRKGKKGNTKEKEENWTGARHVYYTGINCHHAFLGTTDDQEE